MLASILVALASGKNFLLLDEPYASLDPTNAEPLTSILKKRIGTTLITSHDLFLTLETSKSIQFLKDGKIVWKNISEDITIEQLKTFYKEFA